MFEFSRYIPEVQIIKLDNYIVYVIATDVSLDNLTQRQNIDIRQNPYNSPFCLSQTCFPAKQLRMF